MAGFFPIFFKKFWSYGADATITTARLGLANSIAGLLIALVSPMLGAIADKGSAKKKFLFMFAYLGVAMTSALFLVRQGDWAMAVFCYVMAFIGFAGSNVFYNALIKTASSEEKMDMVSSLGYSLGYLGGGVLFAINVWMFLQPEVFGLEDGSQAVRVSFLMVGSWWGIFSIPVFLFVKEPQKLSKQSYWTIIIAGFRQLSITFKEIKQLKPILLFLVAYWFYIDGVDTIVVMSVNYGMTIGFSPDNLIIALLIVQFVGFPATMGFGYLSQWIGTKPPIYLAIFVYFFMCIWGAFLRHSYEFYILAICIGLVQGGIQALSRSFYARMIPKEKSAEYFGFFNMIGKFGTIIGPEI